MSNVGQSSAFTPAVCFHNNLYHGVFVSNDDARQLLHIVSPDGIAWSRKQNVRQSTKFAPAIVSFNGTLRIVFVANNPTNTLLQSTYDEAFDIWTSDDGSIVQETSGTGPALFVGTTFDQNFDTSISTNHLMIQFVANNDSNDLLVKEIDSFVTTVKKSAKPPVKVPSPEPNLKNEPIPHL